MICVFCFCSLIFELNVVDLVSIKLGYKIQMIASCNDRNFGMKTSKLQTSQLHIRFTAIYAVIENHTKISLNITQLCASCSCFCFDAYLFNSVLIIVHLIRSRSCGHFFCFWIWMLLLLLLLLFITFISYIYKLNLGDHTHHGVSISVIFHLIDSYLICLFVYENARNDQNIHIFKNV